MGSGNHQTARGFLGREIRRARDDQKLTRKAIADILHVSPELVAAWESGRQPPLPKYLNELVRMLEFGPDILLRFLDDLVDGEVSPEWTGKWRTIEECADMLLSYEHSFVPGLLQSEEYARALIQHGQPAADINDKLTDRINRQELIHQEDAPTCVFILDERILRNRVVSAPIMAEQMHKLIEASKLPNVIIQVFPEDAGFHLGQSGAFMIAKFEGKEVVYQDGTWRGEVLENSDDVAAFSRIWVTMQTEALNQASSLGLIEEAVRRWSE